MGVVVGENVHIGGKRVRLREVGGSMEISPSMAAGAFMPDMLAGLPEPRCAQCVREQGPLTVVGGQMDDVATTGGVRPNTIHVNLALYRLIFSRPLWISPMLAWLLFTYTFLFQVGRLRDVPRLTLFCDPGPVANVFYA